MSVVNRKAMEGTILAHTDGGVPNIILEVDNRSSHRRIVPHMEKGHQPDNPRMLYRIGIRICVYLLCGDRRRRI